MRTSIRTMVAAAVFLMLAGGAAGQAGVDELVVRLSQTPAVSGHEEALTKILLKELKEFGPKTDNLGNVYVTLGSGAPHRLIATAIDVPGYVVSEITADGYLRVQRLPQAPPNAVFDTLRFAQPVSVITRSGESVAGVFAGLSVHLQPGRPNPPKMNHVEDLYVDIGAKSAEEVRAAHVNLLDPVIEVEGARRIGNTEVGGDGVGDRFGAEALVQLVSKTDPKTLRGTLTVAFVTQQWTGGRGLNRLLTELHPDEMIFVGRINPDPHAAATEPKLPGAGVLLGVSGENANTVGFTTELEKLAKDNGIKAEEIPAAAPRLASYVKGASFPERFVQVGVATKWPVTPIEVLDENDVKALGDLLFRYTGATERKRGGEFVANGRMVTSTLERLATAYGASGHESTVREIVKALLPDWARNRTTTDAAGNLVLHLGEEEKDEKTPRIAFVAHMDEIGYEVKKIEDDGRLQADVLGGGYPQYFLGHMALVHKKDGSATGAVMELPAGWDKPNFEWPTSLRSMDEPAHVYVGTKSKEETEKLGIAPGDYITIPKQYRPLFGTRANARSFDDRVGDAALIEAVKALGPELPGRDVTFVWSTQEEVGLKGAAAFAQQAEKEGHVPDFVFAIDTFVSSDSPLESKRFADAEVGKGFVVRAVDNSNIVPLKDVDRVVALAKENHIPVQYGVTGGGNDGAVFTRFGSVDVALGWPLRYSHSPAELIDTKDLDALAKIVEVLARKW